MGPVRSAEQEAREARRISAQESSRKRTLGALLQRASKACCNKGPVIDISLDSCSQRATLSFSADLSKAEKSDNSHLRVAQQPSSSRRWAARAEGGGGGGGFNTVTHFARGSWKMAPASKKIQPSPDSNRTKLATGLESCVRVCHRNCTIFLARTSLCLLHRDTERLEKQC